ncbi:MAG: hypothetical protein PWP11_3278 [Thauera sp.]|nr:hypothetical protein [Thauera sp.]MDI3492001.1 hypothetical protein [Thauera sp.]
MGNRATITIAPFDKKNACIYVHWNGGRESVEAFCKAAHDLGYRSPESDPAYALARLTGLIATCFGIDDDTSIGVGTVDELIDAGDDNGCYVIGGRWHVVERRDCGGQVFKDTFVTDDDVSAAAASIVEEIQAAAGAVKALRSERCKAA